MTLLRTCRCGACGCVTPVFVGGVESRLSRGSDAFWHAAKQEVVCFACGPATPPTISDTAGASAAAEGERRKARRVAAVRRRYGDHAAAVAEQLAEREIRSDVGQRKQRQSRLAAYIERELGAAVIALHDRLIPGTRGNIDHIYVAPGGVWVVDAKAYTGKLTKREVGPLWRRDNEVFIAGKNRTSLARGLEQQVAAVVAALRSDTELSGTHVHAVLCFVESEWDLSRSHSRSGTYG